MKSKLIPQDGDMCAMINEVTKMYPGICEHAENYTIHVSTDGIKPEIIQALTGAISGRLGQRFITSETSKHGIIYYVNYGDWEQYPEEIRMEQVKKTKVPGTKHCRKLKEVDAIQVDRDKLQDLQRFTGGGTMTIPRTPNGVAKYEFTDNHGLIVTVYERWYIIREESGRMYGMDMREFLRDFEIKGDYIIADDPNENVTCDREKIEKWYDETITPKMVPWDKLQAQAQTLFDKEFGTEIFSRFTKLREEYAELLEALDDVLKAPGMFDNAEALQHLIDEVGDVQAVIFHIGTLLNTTPKEMLAGAIDKVIKRKTNPDYKRYYGDKTIGEK